MRQFNVELPDSVKKAIIRLQGKQQAVNGEKMSLTEIVLDSFSLWFAVDELGLLEAFEEAKTRALENLLKDSKIELSGEDVATLMRSIRKAVDEVQDDGH